MNFSDIFSSIDFFGAAYTIVKVIYIISVIAFFICKSIGIYFLATRTKQKNTWMAFIPVLQDMKVFNMAGLSSKVYVIFYCVYRALLSAQLEWGIFAPIWWIGIAIYVVGLVYVRYQMAKNFGGSQTVCVLNVIFEPIVLLYIVYKKCTHQYLPQHSKVDTYLKAYSLYEDPATFEDPNAAPEPTFGRQAQTGWYQNTNNVQNQDQNYYQNPPIQINVEKENNSINLNTDKE